MKRFSFLTIGLIVISIGSLSAQTNQGKLLLGLSSGSDMFDLSYTTTKIKSDAGESEDANKGFSVFFQPKMSYFVIDNLAIGLDLDIGLITTKSGYDNDKYTTTSLSTGPFLRYYIPTSKVLPFFELSGSVGAMNSKNDYSDNTYREDQVSKTGIMSFGGGIGLAVPLGERVMLDILAGYHSVTYKDREDNEDNERVVLGTLGLEIGFMIILGSN